MKRERESLSPTGRAIIHYEGEQRQGKQQRLAAAAESLAAYAWPSSCGARNLLDEACSYYWYRETVSNEELYPTSGLLADSVPWW